MPPMRSRSTAGASVSSPDAVNVCGGTSPQPLERRVAAFARRGAQADARQKAVSSKPKASHWARCELLTDATLS